MILWSHPAVAKLVMEIRAFKPTSQSTAEPLQELSANKHSLVYVAYKAAFGSPFYYLNFGRAPSLRSLSDTSYVQSLSSLVYSRFITVIWLRKYVVIVLLNKIFLFRVCGVNVLVLSLQLRLSYQHTRLQSLFHCCRSVFFTGMLVLLTKYPTFLLPHISLPSLFFVGCVLSECLHTHVCADATSLGNDSSSALFSTWNFSYLVLRVLLTPKITTLELSLPTCDFVAVCGLLLIVLTLSLAVRILPVQTCVQAYQLALHTAITSSLVTSVN